MLIEQQAVQEQELIEKDRKYSSLQEEVEAQRMVIAKLRLKYKQFKQEVQDLERENQGTNVDYIDTIRE